MSILNNGATAPLAAVLSVRPSWTRGAKIAGFATLAAAIMALNVPNPAMAASFSNGNFDTPSHPGYVNIPSPGTIGSWIVSGGNVDHGDHPAQTSCQGGAGQCVDLNGSGPGMIIQTFDTVCVPKYQVDFWMSRHKLLGDTNTPATMVASINSTTIGGTFTHSLPGVIPTDGKWEHHSFTFVATSPTTTLSFKSTTNGRVAGAGPQVDSVTVKFIGCQ